MKIRDIRIAKGNGHGTLRNPNTASPLERRVVALEEQLYEMSKGLQELLTEVNRQFDFILDQQAEANLRMMFVMQFQKFKKQSAIIGADGVAEVQTLYDIYLASRDQFKAQLERMIDAEREALAKAAAADEAANPELSFAPEPEPKPEPEPVS